MFFSSLFKRETPWFQDLTSEMPTSQDDTEKVSEHLCPCLISNSAIGPKVHGFESGRERWDFKGDKIP
jgi:hypothetical protein